MSCPCPTCKRAADHAAIIRSGDLQAISDLATRHLKALVQSEIDSVTNVRAVQGERDTARLELAQMREKLAACGAEQMKECAR